jgi:hypothetical protein
VCPLLLSAHRVTVRSGRHEPNWMIEVVVEVDKDKRRWY